MYESFSTTPRASAVQKFSQPSECVQGKQWAAGTLSARNESSEEKLHWKEVIVGSSE